MAKRDDSVHGGNFLAFSAVAMTGIAQAGVGIATSLGNALGDIAYQARERRAYGTWIKGSNAYVERSRASLKRIREIAIDPALDDTKARHDIIAAVTPLHQQLHSTAVRIGSKGCEETFRALEDVCLRIERLRNTAAGKLHGQKKLFAMAAEAEKRLLDQQ